MGLKTGVNRSKKTHAGLVRLQSSRIRHSNLSRTGIRTSHGPNFAIDTRRRLHKTAYSDFLRSPKSLKTPLLCWTPPLIPHSAAGGRNQVGDDAGRALSAVSFRRSAFGNLFSETSSQNAKKSRRKSLLEVLRRALRSTVLYSS